jgi:Tfp pilus assembly protein PilF
MIDEAEKQLASSLKQQDMICTQLEYAKIYIRKDQPLRAIELYEKAMKTHKFEVHLLTGIA